MIYRASVRQQSLADDDYQFVEQPSDDFFCPVTMGLLLNPHETSCCGKHLSQEAAIRILKEGGACPLCNAANWATVLSKHFQREVKQLHVLCRYQDKGCKWKGELAAFQLHIQSCGFQVRNIMCPLCFVIIILDISAPG